MQVASLELCKQLWELSGWRDTHYFYKAITGLDYMVVAQPDYDERRDREPTTYKWDESPAYDLSYLLRKLPKRTVIKKVIYGLYGLVLTPSTSDGSWIADYYSGGWNYFDDNRQRENWLHHGDTAKLTEADTPEDAACKLAIELFKQGILTKEHNHGE